MTVITDVVLSSSLSERFHLRHIDTSDHRPIGNVGRLDVTNVVLGLRTAFAAAWAIGRGGVELMYMPIAKQRLPFLRDALFLIVARAAGMTTLVHLHAEGFSEFARSQPRWMRFLMRRCLQSERVHGIVVGECLREEFEGLVPASRIHVLPNGITDLGEPDGDRDAGQIAPTVLYLATLWSAKGVFELLESATRLRDRVPRLRVVAAGDWYSPAEAEAARRFIADNDLGECIQMCGPIGPEAKRALLSSATVLTLPSHTEGHPLVILEALSAGLPVVATRVGAVPETVDDGIEGFLVDVGDVDGLTDRLARILESPPLRAEMSRRARDRYEREFAVERFAERLAAVWDAAAGAAPPRATDAGAEGEVGAAAL